MKPELKKQHLLWYKNAALNMQQMIDEDFSLTEAEKRTLKKTIKIFKKLFKETKKM